MVSLNSEETLHDYLRRYFAKVCKSKERQFAEEKELAKEFAIDIDLSDRSGS
jgi:hypothetical protein